MPTRATSLQNSTLTGLTREVGSKYDKIKLVADNIDAIEAVADVIAAGGVGQLLGIAPIKGVQYMSSVSAPNETITVTSGLNAFSVDSFTLADGASIVVEDNAVYKVL